MSRPLRIEFAGALYHITARGNARQAIYDDDQDRHTFLEYLSKVIKRYDWLCHAYCLMDNHYHLLVETQCPTLSKGMKHLNGNYTQAYNRRHNRVGHLFQGRYKSILVEKDSYLQELSRYIVLNPVRARMVRSAKDWPWSSYRAITGLAAKPDYLTTDCILGLFGKKRAIAQQSYRQFVAEGKRQASVWSCLRNQVYLGSDEFVQKMQLKIDAGQSLEDIPKPQKQAPPKSLDHYDKKHQGRNLSMVEAYRSGHYTLKEIGSYFDVSIATVSRALKAFDV